MYMCADVDMYAVCMLYICACPYGGQKPTLDAILQMLSTFLETGSLADLVLTGSPASTSSVPGVQVLDLAFMVTWQAFHSLSHLLRP